MLEIVECQYCHLSFRQLDELFSRRKETFKDRLNWSVNCIDDKEFDEYDNEHASYLLGYSDGGVICGVRFREIKFPNMIMGTFACFFKNLNMPDGNYIESSRFFVDKVRSKKTMTKQPPASLQLYLAMIRYSKKYNYDGILTLVSHQMLKILHLSGWNAHIIQEGISEKKEKVYVVKLPTDNESEQTIIKKIKTFMNKNSGRGDNVKFNS
ncbi:MULTISPECIES: acyl-homoserine-lactone synthase [Erwinia]|uniref:Acyl-homoserine-lactone synthase n=1 Tax=Erwinia rhapontici TaxID=55212 RepID=A0ABM7MX44_ERWRD|nr:MULTISPECIES: acyl-homoserine-lactone synthase [Erwinia]MBP2154570.1 acyl homoserine lactone synthase [Erwinia rhapontici]NNS06410.1 acyl-homoserine-lactone synthase [Erwinia sp. JH02]BCQ33769.1 acyl-homoserine-lactone synthase [Erwinia rhapontici]BCQ43707.1 acyl-homoserine-lactone synthase [Erwinia rhapontici]